MDYEPISVALKFGFLAVLYLFLLWVARSGLKDLRRAADAPRRSERDEFDRGSGEDAWITVEGGEGLSRGQRFDLFGGVSIGRSGDSDIQIGDRYASSLHARIYPRGSRYFIEDMNSTNGTVLNGSDVTGEMELVPGDLIAIGDTSFRFEAGD